MNVAAAQFGMLMIFIYVASMVIGLWIYYALTKAAVRNGVTEAVTNLGLRPAVAPQPPRAMGTPTGWTPTTTDPNDTSVPWAERPLA